MTKLTKVSAFAVLLAAFMFVIAASAAEAADTVVAMVVDTVAATVAAMVVDTMAGITVAGIMGGTTVDITVDTGAGTRRIPRWELGRTLQHGGHWGWLLWSRLRLRIRLRS